MIIKKIRNCIGSRRGMTLVEVVVSVCIIAIVALMSASAIGSALGLFQRGSIIQTISDQAFSNAERAGESTTPGTVSFMVEGRRTSVNGEYSQYIEGEEPQVIYLTFEAD